MANVFIIHGAYGSPKENWYPWLKTELDKCGCRVFVPEFPTPENQNLENWLKAFEPYRQYVDKNSIVVGHSIGVSFLLTIIESLSKPIRAAFFVSGFVSLLNNQSFDGINRSFVEKEFNWSLIKQNCNKFYIIHSDDDPYVSLEKARELSNRLGVPPFIMRYAGHFNEGSGYTKFDLLLQKIKNEL